jgi:hypothetical protein
VTRLFREGERRPCAEMIRDHECNENATLYGLPDGTVTNDEERAKREGATWGSVACSVCGLTAMSVDMMRAP